MQGVLCTSSGKFKHNEPHRTFSNYILTEIARYKDFFHTSVGWFDCNVSSPNTCLQGIQCVHDALCTNSDRFTHIEPHQFFRFSFWYSPTTLHCVKEVFISCYLCKDVAREDSMKFDVLEPHQTTLLFFYPLKR